VALDDGSPACTVDNEGDVWPGLIAAARACADGRITASSSTGATVAAAFDEIYYFERAAETLLTSAMPRANRCAS